MVQIVVHSLKETAEILGVSEKTVRRLVVAKKIGYVNMGVGGERTYYGFTDAQIAEFLSAQSVTPGPATPAPAPARAVRRSRTGTPEQTASGVAADVVARAPKWQPGRAPEPVQQ